MSRVAWMGFRTLTSQARKVSRREGGMKWQTLNFLWDMDVERQKSDFLSSIYTYISYIEQVVMPASLQDE